MARFRSPTISELLADTVYKSMVIRGATVLSRREMLVFPHIDTTAYIHRQHCYGSPAELFSLLSKQGVYLAGKEAIDYLAQKIPLVTDFEPEQVLDHPGFEAGHFGFLDGSSAFPESSEAPACGYERRPNLQRVLGVEDDWQEQVGGRFANDPLPMLSAFLPLAAALREVMQDREPMLLELVGPPGTSKRDMQIIAASVQGSGGVEPVPFRMLIDDPVKTFAEHRGSLLLVGDPALGLAAESPNRCQALIAGFLQACSTIGDGAKSCFIISGRSLAEWAGDDTEIAQHVRDRVMTLVIDARRPFGAYQQVSEDGLASDSARLRQAVQLAQGSIFREFVTKIIQVRAADPEAFDGDIARKIGRVLAAIDADPQDVINHRKAEHFGMTAAAAKLAKSYGLLDEGWNCISAIVRCYRRFYRAPPRRRDVKDIVKEIAHAALRLDGDIRPSKLRIEQADAVVRDAGEDRKLFIPMKLIKRHPELYKRLYEPATKTLLIAPDPVSSQQRLGALGRVRCYAFTAPEEDEGDDDL